MFRSSLFWARTARILLTKRRLFVSQTAQTDCGVACTLTVMNLSGRRGDPVSAVDQMDPDRTGTSLEQIRQYFEQKQEFTTRAIAAPAHKLGTLRGRVILHMHQMHYVVLLNIGRNGVLVFDPAKGPVFYPTADFAKLYSGYALEITPPDRRTPHPEKQDFRRFIGTPPKSSVTAIALFVVGVACRLLECTIMLCIVAALFLVLNRASTSSILMIFVLIAICGALLLLSRNLRLKAEGSWAHSRQVHVWRRLAGTFVRGKDLNGFRGQTEREVASSIRHGLSSAVTLNTQVAATFGSVIGMTVLLLILNPWLSLAHIALFSLLLIIMQLDTVQVCRVSIRNGIGRYTKLGLGQSPVNATIAADYFGEISKWTVIGFAGFSVLLADLSPVALMFWILTGMQIVPLDFRRANRIAQALTSSPSIPELTATEVPLRKLKVLGSVNLKTSHEKGILFIDGLAPLTATLQQRDLTVREQRLILGDIVRETVSNLDTSTRPQIGAIRIFASGHEATQADFEQLMISREVRPTASLPAIPTKFDNSTDGNTDRITRDLHSCTPEDFPVFWDFRSQIKIQDLRDRMRDTRIEKAGHLTMKRLTFVEVV